MPKHPPACSVANTECPVSAAVRAARAVSLSRTSPMMIVFGSSRRDIFTPEAKSGTSAPTSRWDEYPARPSERMWYSIGSSTVTTCAPSSRWRSATDARSVVLPLPVTPETRTRPGVSLSSSGSRRDSLPKTGGTASGSRRMNTSLAEPALAVRDATLSRPPEGSPREKSVLDGSSRAFRRNSSTSSSTLANGPSSPLRRTRPVADTASPSQAAQGADKKRWTSVASPSSASFNEKLPSVPARPTVLSKRLQLAFAVDINTVETVRQ